jgi:hypothetical protein
MKKIRNLMTFGGLFVAVLALGTTGARAQRLYSTQFAGTFTIPFEVQWGTMTLPAGEYTLSYGIQRSGANLVEIAGKAKGSPHGVILAGPIAKETLFLSAPS